MKLTLLALGALLEWAKAEDMVSSLVVQFVVGEEAQYEFF
jgi:hypothetical protein